MEESTEVCQQRTLIMVKPDAVQRGLIHKVVLKLEQRGFKLIAMKLMQPDRSKFESHYTGYDDTEAKE